ncbi:MAG: hypothetical protein ACRELZ_20210 [Candidatus Rokuibacteriota bacterium]
MIRPLLVALALAGCANAGSGASTPARDTDQLDASLREEVHGVW